MLSISPSRRLTRRNPQKKRVVLVVEDDPGLQAAMSRELVLLGFDVRRALHCDAAIRHLSAAPVDLACIHVGLPNQSGYELCEYIRCHLGLRGLPIILTSECGSVQDMASAEYAGGNAFLRKPFSSRELGQCVRSLFDQTPLGERPVHELEWLAAATVSRQSLPIARSCLTIEVSDENGPESGVSPPLPCAA
jgi:DNA-binding response OmpR family regulator